MKKLSKIFSFIFIIAMLFTVASCSKGIGIFGELSCEAKRTELDVTADFEKNEKLEEANTSISIKLYTSEDVYKTTKNLKLTNGINGTVTFTSLTQDTEYIVKLFVSYEGQEEMLDSITVSTLDTGDSEETAKVITTVEEFKSIKDDANGYYKLGNDIDFDEETVSLFTTISNGFSGTFDGAGFTLSNIKLSASESVGVFGTLIDATIKNLKIDKIALTVSSQVKYCGAVAGYVKNSTIENVEVSEFYISGNAVSQSNNSYVGCFIGQALNSGNGENIIKNCKVIDSTIAYDDLKVAVISTPKYNYTGLFTGGVSDMTTIESCVAEGAIIVKTSQSNIANVSIGGFAGYNSSNKKIVSCITNVDIDITRNMNSSKTNTIETLVVGGFVGSNTSGYCNVEDSLAIADITVSSHTNAEVAVEVKLADKAYIGGFIGLFNSRSTSGVKNCVYQPKADGIVIKAMPSGTYELDDDKNITNTIYDIYVGVTFAKVDASLTAKITNVFATEGKVIFDVTKALMFDGDDQTEDNITDEAKLTDIKNAILILTDVDANAKNNLSESVKNYSFN